MHLWLHFCLSIGVIYLLAAHWADVSTPFVHDVIPTNTKPVLHVGVHNPPSAKLEVHVPTLPFDGGVEASHAEEIQVPLLVPAQPVR